MPVEFQVNIMIDNMTMANTLVIIAAFFQIPNTTSIQIVISTLSINEFISTPALPPNARTAIRMEAVGRDVYVFFNNSLVTLKMTRSDRISAESAFLYVSNPLHTPAPASISAVTMTAISALSSRPVSAFNGPVAPGIAFEKTGVPANYSLSFDIIPKGYLPSWTSILHYTNDNTDASRIPGIWHG